MEKKRQKKRKRESFGHDSAQKKIALDDQDSERIQITFSKSGAAPVLVTAPGLAVPSCVFKAYKEIGSKDRDDDASDPATHRLLLHSSEHPHLDYTTSIPALDKDLEHFLAIFDPATNQLQLIRAHHLSLHSVLRTPNDSTDNPTAKTALQQRLDLGREFGSIRSKRALEGRAANIIAQNSTNGQPIGKVESAILASVAETATTEAQKAEQTEAIFASRPIPEPNLDAETVDQVYTFEVLVPAEAARHLRVGGWQDNARKNISMDFSHRVPANRVNALGKSNDVQRLQALRYLTLLLEFNDTLGKAGRKGRKVPKLDTLRRKLGDYPEPLVDCIVKKFADPARELPKWYLDRLYTHMCALALFVDGWSTNTTDLRLDLRLDNKEISQYYRELGCGVRKPNKTEQERMKLSNAQAAVTRIAYLKLPLDFPKASVGRRQR